MSFSPGTGSAEECRLLGGPPAWFAQAFLGLIALGALIYKRHREKPQRPLDVWGFDVSKQIASMLIAHICGMLIAAVVAMAGHRQVSECAWYFVAFSFDTTLGVAVTLALHKAAMKAAMKRRSQSRILDSIADCGNYGQPRENFWSKVLPGKKGTPPQASIFWPQLLEWVLAVVLSRIVCGFVVMVLRHWLAHIAKALDAMFAGSPIALLYFVMICCPLLMNLFQAIIQDMALKWQQHHGHSRTQPLPIVKEDKMVLLTEGHQRS